MRHLVMFLVVLGCAKAWASDDLVLPTVEFTATAVQQVGAFQSKESIHYADGKLRIDRNGGLSSTILNLKTQTQYLLMVNHTYLVLPMDDELFRRFIARSVDVNGARKLGTERIEGFLTTKYAFGHDGALDAAGSYWLTKSGMMLRREYEDGLFGKPVHHLDFLTHVEVANQPAALFSIPTGFKRVR